MILQMYLLLTLVMAAYQHSDQGDTNLEYKSKNAAAEKLPRKALHKNGSTVCAKHLWTYWDGMHGSCHCGDSLEGIVRCELNDRSIYILMCYCMSRSGSKMIVGSCFYGCFGHATFLNRYINYSTEDDLTHPCDLFNRTGVFCSKCINDTGVPAYSYSLQCVHCEFHWYNIARYIAIAYVPLTVFLILIVVLTVSVNSAPLHGFIFVAQMTSTSVIIRLLEAQKIHRPKDHLQNVAYSIGSAIYGIWNLDFFRSLYHPFCLHPGLSTLQVMSLDYIIAAYPLAIIILVYALVELYSRDCRPVVLMWKPFRQLFACFRHQLNIKTSLVDAFGTFFSLSYVKMLSTTVDLTTATSVWEISGRQSQPYMYYDSTFGLFTRPYLPYAAASVIIFLLFNILPVLFLLIYPQQFFQRRIPPNIGQFLQPFMDTLLGAYKDGTGGTRDCRFFVVIYLITRVAVFASFMATRNSFSFVAIAAIVTITGMLVAVIQPYKSNVYNTVDTILVLFLAFNYTGIVAFFFAETLSTRQAGLSRCLMPLSIMLPFVYVCGLVFYHTFIIGTLPIKFLHMLETIYKKCSVCKNEKLQRERHVESNSIPPAANERTPLISGQVLRNIDS